MAQKGYLVSCLADRERLCVAGAKTVRWTVFSESHIVGRCGLSPLRGVRRNEVWRREETSPLKENNIMNALQAMKMQLNVAHTENGDLALLIMMI